MEETLTSHNTSAASVDAPSSPLTKLDWSIPYNRASLHLSNQLRGKRFPSDQLVLFDNNLDRLPIEVQERARAQGIDVIGFDLSVPQQKAFEAALYLINASGRQRKIKITPQNWIHACQLRAYDRKGGYRFYSQQEREDAFKALVTLAVKPWLMCYHKMEGGREIRQTRLAPLWRLTLTHSTNVASPAQIKDVTADYIGKAEWFEIEFEDIWFDQLDNFYIYKPRNLFERIASALTAPREKIPSSLHPFLEWIFAEAGRVRNKQPKGQILASSYELRADWREVALQCRLHKQLEKRNYKRAREMLLRNAAIAQRAAILTHFGFEGTDFLAAFSARQFEDLEAYLKGRRRPADSKRQGLPQVEPPPWNPKKMMPHQIKELIQDWRREIDRVKDRTKYGKGKEGDDYQLKKLTNWIKTYEAVLYGREH